MGNASLIRLGAGHVYVAPYAADRDYKTLAGITALIAAPDSATPGEFLTVGYTQGGISFNAELDTKKVEADQKRAPVKKFTIGMTGALEAELLQVSLRSLQIAAGGGEITTTATETIYTPPENAAEYSVIWVDDPAAPTWWLAIPKAATDGGLTIGGKRDDEAKMPWKAEVLDTDDYDKPFYHGFTPDHEAVTGSEATPVLTT